jgi:transcriptional regulator with XRE-family HTH domain
MEPDGSFSFSAWVKQQRALHNWTQEDLALRSTVPVESIRRFERDPANHPSRQNALLLAACCGIPAADQPAFVYWARGLAEAAPPASVTRLRWPTPSTGRRVRAQLTPLTALIGRETDIARVTALLTEADVRLLTLTGPGGVGIGSKAAYLLHRISLRPLRHRALGQPASLKTSKQTLSRQGGGYVCDPA